MFQAACSGGVDTVRTSQPAEPGPVAQTVSGFVGSPSLTNATVTVMVDDGATTVSARSGGDASYMVRVDKSLALPILVQVEGGTDLVTGQTNDMVLSALSFDPSGQVSVSYFSTLASEMVTCSGSTTDTALDTAWSHLQSRTGLAYISGEGELNSTQLGELMRVNLALAETALRTRTAMAAAGSELGTGDVLRGIACDLADDGLLNATAAGADRRLLSVFRSAEAGVLAELIAGTPYLDGQPAGAQIDDTLRQISGDPDAAVADTMVPDALLDRARTHLTLMLEEFDDPELMDLAVATAGSPAEAASEVRTNLDTNRLTALWSVPERVALADDGQIDALSAAMTAQHDAAAPVVSLSASETTVDRNATVTLSWASANARHCRAAGDWQGNRSADGVFTTGALGQTAQFLLYCAGLGGVGQASAQVAVVDAAQRPVVSLSADQPTIVANRSTIIRWNSRNASECSASGAWSGSRAVVGSASSGPLAADSDFTLTCTGPGGTDSATLRISVTPAPDPAPTLSFTTSRSSIQSGQSVSLTWNATNASSCQAGNGWSGSRATSGTETRGPLSADTTFSLTCTGPGGSVTRTRSVAVSTPSTPPAQPAPTLSFTTSQASVQSGQSVSLTWNATNASSCQAGNGWSGSRATSGTETRGPLTSNTTFSLTCSGSGGNVSRSVSVSVTSAPPAAQPGVTLTAADTLVNAGARTTLSWSSTNASACTATGGWSGSRGTSGSESVGPLNQQTTYSLNCSGSGGSAIAMVSVSVRGSVTLNWVAPTENVDGTRLTDLSGYRIYYGEQSRSYTGMVEVTNRTATSASIQLPSGTYHVAMTALDGQGNESAYSNEVLKTVP